MKLYTKLGPIERLSLSGSSSTELAMLLITSPATVAVVPIVVPTKAANHGFDMLESATAQIATPNAIAAITAMPSSIRVFLFLGTPSFNTDLIYITAIGAKPTAPPVSEGWQSCKT